MTDSRARQPTRYGGIYQRGEVFQVRFRDGATVRTRSFRTLSEARRFKATVDSGAHKPTSREPFRDYARRWVVEYTGRTSKGVTASTRASYADSLERFAIPQMGGKRIGDVSAPMLKAYVAFLAKQGLSPASVRRHFAVVRALFADAVGDGLLSVNPAREVRVIVPEVRVAIDRRLSAEQTRDLLEAIPAEHGDLLYVLASTGLRISEALSLRWLDLGHDEHGPTLTVGRSKTRAGLRTIALTPEAAQRLMRRRNTVENSAPGAPVFANGVGQPIDPKLWRRRVFKPAAVAAGVPTATPHWLRHGVASLMAEAGYGPADIAKHLGHADGGALALKTYIHPVAQRVDFLDGRLGS